MDPPTVVCRASGWGTNCHTTDALRKREKQLERDIEKINKQLIKIEELLADSALYDDENKAKLTKALQQQGDLKTELAKTEEAWLEVLEQLGA